MLDLKCEMQVQLDRLWIKPEDMAHALGIRVSSVRSWLDPASDSVPLKFAFDWLAMQTEKLNELSDERDSALSETYSRFGRHILRWYRAADLPESEPVGLHNLATRLAIDRCDAEDIDVAIVYACRDDVWIARNIDSYPDVDLKAEFAADAESLGVTPTEIANALDITPASVKYWKNPKRVDMLPVDEVWGYLDTYADALENRIAQLIEQTPNPMPYHPMTRKGSLTQRQRIDNRAALAAASRLEKTKGIKVGFAYI